MGSECGTWCAKYLLCFFNFLIFVLGTIVLGTGVWLAVDKASLVALLKMVENEKIHEFMQPQVIEQMAYVLIGIGSIMFFMSFLGYCGAIRESRCLLMTYATFMILLLVAELLGGAVTFLFRVEARRETKHFLQSTITDYYQTIEHTDAVTLMWNKMMMTFSCCGVNDYKDFESSQAWMSHKGNRTIPEVCCILREEDGNYLPRDNDCPTNPSESNSFYKTGCYEVFVDWIISHRTIIIGVLLGVGIIELFAVFLAIVLYKTFTKYRGMRL